MTNNINTGARGSPSERAAWYILRVGGGLDTSAERTLRDLGWDVFCPREVKWRASSHRRRAHEAEYPRYPGYLFLAASAGQWPAWREWPLSRFPIRVLALGGRPAALAPGEIDRLRAQDRRRVPHAQSVPLHRAFVPGQQVRVVAGAWRDHTTEIGVIDEQGARISVQLFGRPAEIVVPLTWLEAQ